MKPSDPTPPVSTHHDAVIAVRNALILTAKNVGRPEDALALASLTDSYTGMTDYMGPV